MNIAVLLTSYNRKEITLKCLESLYACRLPHSVNISPILVDDGSTDGTGCEVGRVFPYVSVILGNGNLFWNRGMHLAFEHAMRLEPDFVLWLNDDTILVESAITDLLSTYEVMVDKSGGPVIVVGSSVDPVSKVVTYSGLKAVSRTRRFSFRRTSSENHIVECDAMNGNVVLIPRRIYQIIGNVDPIFEHAMGDLDYALRARKKGFRIFVAAGALGYCARNPVRNTAEDGSLSFSRRWSLFLGRKGLPPRSWYQFVRRHSGLSWPVYFFYPYLNFISKALISSMRSSR